MSKKRLAPLRIGLTGGIGSGKSTACNLFEKWGVPVIDADQIARQLLQPREIIRRRVVNHLKKTNSTAVDSAGRLYRKKLRQEAFSSPKLRRALERIIHPAVFQIMEKQYRAINAPYCLFSVPLLLETKQQHRLDRVLVIDAPESLQIKRATARDNTQAELVQRVIKAQIPRQERLLMADDVIRNHGSIKSLEKQVAHLHASYLTISKKR